MGETTQTRVVGVRGMTCTACETRVSEAAESVEGVMSARANQAKGELVLEFRSDTTGAEDLVRRVTEAVSAVGYTVVPETKAAPSSAGVLALAAVLIAGFLVINAAGGFNFLPTIDSSVGLGMVFVAGLLTSFHCVAMCGGLVLAQRRRGGLPYLAGRVVSYTVLGAAVGALGSVLSFSPVTKGLLAAAASLFMVVFGLKMLGWLPRLGWLKVPRLVPVKTRLALAKRGPFVVGLLNGLMPCGPLQTMQLYALGTGSAVPGGLSMFLFSLGTVPLLVAFGALSGMFSLRGQQRLAQASALLVIFFGVVMAGRALDLSGASAPVRNLATAVANLELPAGTATLQGGVQTVGFDLKASSYAPITVQKGIPVEWTIRATAATLNGCNGEVVVPALGLRKKLAVGSNVIKFTPETTGTLVYTCWMGMITSTIQVVDRLGDAPAAPTLRAGLTGDAALGCCSPVQP